VKHILTAIFIGLFLVWTTATAMQHELMIDRMQGHVVELRQQVDAMQSDINFLRVENGVLWRKYQEWRYK
jgi:hypothetical protein